MHVSVQQYTAVGVHGKSISVGDMMVFECRRALARLPPLAVEYHSHISGACKKTMFYSSYFSILVAVRLYPLGWSSAATVLSKNFGIQNKEESTVLRATCITSTQSVTTKHSDSTYNKHRDLGARNPAVPPGYQHVRSTGLSTCIAPKKPNNTQYEHRAPRSSSALKTTKLYNNSNRDKQFREVLAAVGLFPTVS